METTFKKVHTVKDLAISSLVIIAGIVFFFLNKGAGTVLAVVGVLMILVYKEGYKADGEGSVLSKKSLDLCKCCKQSIMEYLDGKDTVPEVKEGHEGGSIRLDIFFNRTSGIAYAKLYDYSNYTYEPLTQTVKLTPPASAKLLDQIQ